MLEQRSLEKEQMDNLQLSGKELHDTLNGLTIINRLLGNTNATLKAVKTEIKTAASPVKIIDLGCGGGDNLHSIAQWCDKQNREVHLTGLDGNQNILDYAKRQNTSQKEIQYIQADILAKDFELPDCDLLISSHFMYHFTDEQLIDFLKKSKLKITRKIIFSELSRSTVAYLLFKIFGPVMPFSKMVKQDGLRAIRRSFKKAELEHIFKEAGINALSIQWKWAFRYLVAAKTKTK